MKIPSGEGVGMVNSPLVTQVNYNSYHSWLRHSWWIEIVFRDSWKIHNSYPSSWRDWGNDRVESDIGFVGFWSWLSLKNSKTVHFTKKLYFYNWSLTWALDQMPFSIVLSRLFFQCYAQKQMANYFLLQLCY